MKTSAKILLAIWVLLPAFGGCSSDPSRTHRGSLLDDKVTAQRVKSELARSGPQFQAVQVQATNGTVVLTGFVSSPELRSRAEQIARGIHRPMRLQNELRTEK